jgi:hypothetical protein
MMVGRALCLRNFGVCAGGCAAHINQNNFFVHRRAASILDGKALGDIIILALSRILLF